MKITSFRLWSPEAVREVCIDYELYTRGCNEEYSKMLDFVRSHRPTKKNIYKVAKDIVDHSEREGDCEYIEHIMHVLMRDAIHTFFIIGEKDDEGIKETEKTGILN